jgi:hypothetical protein
MPTRNIVFVLRKAYALSWYVKNQDEIADCLLDLDELNLDEDKKDVEDLELERKSEGLDWQYFYEKKMRDWFGDQSFNPATKS